MNSNKNWTTTFRKGCSNDRPPFFRTQGPSLSLPRPIGALLFDAKVGTWGIFTSDGPILSVTENHTFYKGMASRHHLSQKTWGLNSVPPYPLMTEMNDPIFIFTDNHLVNSGYGCGCHHFTTTPQDGSWTRSSRNSSAPGRQPEHEPIHPHFFPTLPSSHDTVLWTTIAQLTPLVGDGIRHQTSTGT